MVYRLEGPRASQFSPNAEGKPPGEWKTHWVTKQHMSWGTLGLGIGDASGEMELPLTKGTQNFGDKVQKGK